MVCPTEPGLQVSVVPATLFRHPFLHQLTLGYLMALGAFGCASTQVVPLPPPITPAVPAIEPPRVSPNPAFPEALSLADLSHDLVWQVVTRDSAGARRDSAEHRARVLIRPHRGTGGLLTLDAITTRVVSDSSVVDTLTPISLTPVGSAFRSVGASCGKVTGREISPLLLRHLVLRAAPEWPAVDSLAYRTCVSGIATDVSAVVTWSEPRFANDRFEQVVLISGVMRADSSRMLPMRLSGVIDGRATLLIDPLVKGIRQFTGKTTMHLVASANSLRQVVDQVITFIGDLVPDTQ